MLCKVVGTFNNVDYVPQKPPHPNVIAENQTWPGGFPTTPEGIFSNYPFGAQTLKEFAQTGAGGSQYVTNPNLLSYPLQGVTYVELPNHGVWINCNLNGSGIIVVHNNAINSGVKNTTGTFTGLLIVDHIMLLKGDITGAIVSLRPSPAPDNLGNSSGSVIYSKEALNNAIKNVKLFEYGFGKKRVTVKHWFE